MNGMGNIKNVVCILMPFLLSHLHICFIAYSLLPFHKLSLTKCVCARVCVRIYMRSSRILSRITE